MCVIESGSYSVGCRYDHKRNAGATAPTAMANPILNSASICGIIPLSWE